MASRALMVALLLLAPAATAPLARGPLGTSGRGPPAGGPPSAPLHRGVALGLFSEDPLWSYAHLLREIRGLGASHVSLVVSYYQRDSTSTTIERHPRFTAPDETLVTAIRQAQRLGLQVLLFPILRLSHPRTDGEWRGTLAPADRDAWWRSYGALMLHLARLCARERVALLSVGSELSTLDGERDRPRWAELIGQVRQSYRGALTYSGNWDHYEQVALYDLVDLLGVCAYFGLVRDGEPPTLEALLAGWARHRERLLALAARRGRPLLLTEVGYPSQRGAAARPWDEGAQNPVDLEEQRRCYEAFRRSWTEVGARVQASGEALLAGVYFWNWYGWGGPSSRGYTPRNKPAAAELRRFFDDLRSTWGRSGRRPG